MEGNWSNTTEDGLRAFENPSYSAFSILLLIFAIILGNMLLIAGIRRSRQCQRLFYTMLVSLAIVDILGACLVLTMPAMLLVYGDFMLLGGICAAWHVLEPLLQAVSLLHVAVLAFDAHMALVQPLRYRVASEGWRWLVVQQVAIWVGACVLLVPVVGVIISGVSGDGDGDGSVVDVVFGRECRGGVGGIVAVTRAICMVAACGGAAAACVSAVLTARRHKHVLHAVCSMLSSSDPATAATVICNGTQIIRQVTRLHAVAATFRARPLKQALSNGSTNSAGKMSVKSEHSIEAGADTEKHAEHSHKEIDSQSVCRSISTNSSCSTFPIEPSTNPDSPPAGSSSPTGSQDGIVLALRSKDTEDNAEKQEESDLKDCDMDSNIDEPGELNINNATQASNEPKDTNDTNGYLPNETEDLPSPDTAQSPIEDTELFLTSTNPTDEQNTEQPDNSNEGNTNNQHNVDEGNTNNNHNAGDTEQTKGGDNDEPNRDQNEEPTTAQTEQLEGEQTEDLPQDNIELTTGEPEALLTQEDTLNSGNDGINDLPKGTCIENNNPSENQNLNCSSPDVEYLDAPQNPSTENTNDLTPTSELAKPPPFSRVSRESLNAPIEDKDIGLIIGNGVMNPCFVSGDEEEGISLADAIQVHSPSIRSTVEDPLDNQPLEKDSNIDSLDTDVAECGIRPGRRSILKRDNHRSLRKSVKFASDVNANDAGSKKLVRKGTKHVKVTHSQSNGIAPAANMTFSKLSLQKSLSVAPESESSLDYLSKVNSLQGERATNRLRNEELTIWIVCALVVLLIVLYIPYTIAFTLNAFSSDPQQDSVVLSILQWISYCSGLILPGVIIVLSKEIRGHMSAACCCIPAKYSEETTGPESQALETVGIIPVDEEAIEAVTDHKHPEEPIQPQLQPPAYQEHHTELDNNLLVATLQSAIERLSAEKAENDDDSSSVSTTAMVHNDATALDDLYFDDNDDGEDEAQQDKEAQEVDDATDDDTTRLKTNDESMKDDAENTTHPNENTSDEEQQITAMNGQVQG